MKSHYNTYDAEMAAYQELSGLAANGVIAATVGGAVNEDDDDDDDDDDEDEEVLPVTRGTREPSGRSL